MAGAPQTMDDPLTAAAAARSEVYGFLARAFLPPEENLPGADPGETGASALRRAASALPAALRALGPAGDSPLAAIAEETAALLETVEPEEVEEEYHRTFGHQISQDCPLYETQFLGGQVFQQVQQLADIAGFYLAFGLEVAEGAGERADHISLELEFMQVLAYREAYARTHHGPTEVDLLRDGQRAFLRDHLTRWIPTLARLVERKAAGFYRRIATFTAAWVAAEAAAMSLPTSEAVEYVPATAADAGEMLPCGAERCPVEPLP
jgi:DMSO reductase family type II enzyme chaperone